MAQILDAEGFAFFKRELEFVKKKAYDVLYPELTYNKVFPVSVEANRGADEIVMQTFDHRGRAKVVTGSAKDIPRVDVDGKEHRLNVRPIVSSYGYTVDEIEAAQYANRPLDSMRAVACRRVIEAEMNTITWYGDAGAGLIGFFTAGIARGAAPNGGGGTAWSTKTPDQILADVDLAFAQVFNASNGVERANRLGLPLAQWSRLMNTRLTDSDKTLGKWIVENSVWLTSLDQIVPIIQFAGVDDGLGGDYDVAAVWTYSSDKIEVEIPGATQFMEPEKDGLEYIIIGRARFAGLNLHYPGSAYILTDI